MLVIIAAFDVFCDLHINNRKHHQVPVSYVYICEICDFGKDNFGEQ